MSDIDTLKSNVIDNLTTYYKVDGAVAEAIYHKTILLYHRLFTITNFDDLNTVDDRVLFALIIVIGHYCQITDSTK